MTNAEAARCYGVTKRTIANWRRRGQPMQRRITGADAARLYGVSRRTLYRWVEEGRITLPFRAEQLLTKRPRGPMPNPRSKRYTIGGHTYRPRSLKSGA